MKWYNWKHLRTQCSNLAQTLLNARSFITASLTEDHPASVWSPLARHNLLLYVAALFHWLTDLRVMVFLLMSNLNSLLLPVMPLGQERISLFPVACDNLFAVTLPLSYLFCMLNIPRSYDPHKLLDAPRSWQLGHWICSNLSPSFPPFSSNFIQDISYCAWKIWRNLFKGNHQI